MIRRIDHRLGRLVALGLLTGLPTFAGCGTDEYNGKDTAQDFEKPAATAAPAKTDPPDTGEDLSPRERRKAGAN